MTDPSKKYVYGIQKYHPSRVSVVRSEVAKVTEKTVVVTKYGPATEHRVRVPIGEVSWDAESAVAAWEAKQEKQIDYHAKQIAKLRAKLEMPVEHEWEQR